MNENTGSEQKLNKPEFSVQRYFSVASLFGIVIAAIILCYLFRYFSIEQLIESGEKSNVTISRALQNNIWPHFAPFMQEAVSLTTEELHQHEKTLKTHLLILRSIKGLPVLKVKIFDLHGRTVFSTDGSQIGVQKPPYYAGSFVAKTGNIESYLTYREQFSAIQGTLYNRHIISSYLPIHDIRNGQIRGVFEVYYDVTEQVEAIENNQLMSFFSIIATLSLLYIIMFFISKHADSIIQKQAYKLDSYVDRIEEQNELLEKRVEQRTEALNKAVRELEYHRRELEDRVQERTVELETARDEAVKANKSKSIFLANMSHELRTPLNAILGYTEILVEDIKVISDPTAIAGDLEKIYVSGTHLLGIINDILDISKIESGKMEIFLEQVNIQNTLEELIINANGLSDRNNNQLVLEIEPNLGEFTTDSTKFRQILYNLLSNASKFTQNGEIRIKAVKNIQNDEHWLKITVSDTGIGMSIEQMSHIFENFSQADDSTTRKFGGTGLGLSICKGLCNMLGGTIAVESEERKGSTFILRLPIATRRRTNKSVEEVLQIGPKIDPEQVRLTDTEEIEDQQREKISTVLSVDDDAEVRDLMERFLTRNGFYTYTAASAGEGLELALKIKPDIILTDIMMPDRDGISFIKDLKKYPELIDIPFVVVTIAGERETCKNLGASGYINKPIDWKQLLEIIQINIRKAEIRSFLNTA